MRQQARNSLIILLGFCQQPLLQVNTRPRQVGAGISRVIT